MTEFQRSIRNDIIKVLLSSAWVGIVTLGFQHYATTRGSATAHATAVPVSTTSSLDPTMLTRILSEDGLLDVTPGSSPEPDRAAEFVDAAVKNLGINHVAISASFSEQAGNSIRVELARRGYRQSEISTLFSQDRQRTEYTARGVR